MGKPRFSILMAIVAPWAMLSSFAAAEPPTDYQSARWNPLHFKPAIDEATDEQCLACHRDVIERKAMTTSPAGRDAEETLAWYQTLDAYEGPQDTFHRRHLVSPLAKRLMNFRCNSCHQGHDPKDEASGTTDDGQTDLTLRKTVDPDICLMCHGKFDFTVMPGLAGDWTEVHGQFNNDCMVCHTEFRTKRHLVNFLNAEEIEQAGREDSDTCYGCHGGRTWYAIPYPYVRRPWLTRMPAEPDWAKGRPTEYDARVTR